MPFKIVKKGDKFVVINKDTGAVKGTHPSRELANKQLAALNINVHSSDNQLNFMTVVESTKLEEKDGTKWVKVKGIALPVGLSSNKINYRISNLEENDNKLFSVLVGHRTDYDNPDHNVGEGAYHLDGTDLRYEMNVKNTSTHPDIIEQIMDNLVAPSVQGAYRDIKLIEENGEFKEAIVEGLYIPILALVNKHTRGIEGASIESAIAERIEMEKKDIHEVNTMDKDIFAKQIQEKDRELVDSTKLVDDAKKKIVEKDKSLKEVNDKLKKFEDAEETRVAETHEALVDKICEVNKDLKKEELMEKSDSELEIIERYETEKVDAAVDNSGSGVVNAINESINDAKVNEENILDLNLLEKHGDLTMNEEAYEKFNQDIKKRILGEE